MSSYLIKCIDLFHKNELQNFQFKKKMKNKMIDSFSLQIKQKSFFFESKFSFNSKYKNFIKVINDKNILFLPMAFSQPMNKETYFVYNKTINYYKFENSFISFLINIKRSIKSKNKSSHYKDLSDLTMIRKKIEKKF